MNEIKIPDGHKATILGGTIRIEPIEQKFHRGDIVYDPFMEGVICILYSHRRRDESASFIARYFIGSRILYMNDDGKLERNARLATPEEQQILFTALAKEGKRWNAETLEVEEIPKRILVPESIGIYRCKEDFGIDADGLYIAFNKNTQLLYYNSKYKCWCVCPLHEGYKKIQCYLQPCKREDLKAGDTAFHSLSKTPDYSNLSQYCKIIDGEYHVWVSGGWRIKVDSEKYPCWYKLKPINE